MATERIRAALACAGCLAVAAAGFAFWTDLDAPEYALWAGEGPIDIYPVEAADGTTSLRRRFELVVTNSGRKPLAIKAVEESCSCALAGEVSATSLLPGEQTQVPLELHLPGYGTKATFFKIVSDRRELPPLKVHLRLHGPEMPAPQIESIFDTAQLVAEYPGELLEHVFEVQTIERLAEVPWLTGMKTPYADASFDLMSVSVIQSIPEIEVVRRRYVFQIRFVGPLDENQLLSFRVQPESRTPAIRRKLPPSIRCRLTRQRVAAVGP